MAIPASHRSASTGQALACNLLVLLPLIIGALLCAVDPERYYRSAQEDRLLEWLTFWAFAAAAYRFFATTAAATRRGDALPWFAAGLGCFCLLVALEEISWGQRLFGFRPPAYFLEYNFQQEFNLHNVVDTGLRMAAMQAVLLGYGVMMGALSLAGVVSRWFERLRIVAPPPALIPAFLVLSAVYAWYPVDFTGEWVECSLGIAFLCVAGLTSRDGRSGIGDRRGPAFAAAVAAALAVLTVAALAFVYGTDAEKAQLAREEVELLAADFRSPKLHTRCGIHKRLYTFMREYNQTWLVRGSFAARHQGRPTAARASYLLDPWNSPYWVRHTCADGRAVAFVYSFGPDRRRDGDEWQTAGDDIGAFFIDR